MCVLQQTVDITVPRVLNDTRVVNDLAAIDK